MQSETPNQTIPTSAFRLWLHRLQAWWEWAIRPHPSVTEIGERNTARLLAGLSAALFLTSIVGLVSTIVINRNRPESSNLVSIVFLAALMVVVYSFSRSRWFKWGAALGVLFISGLGHYTLLFHYNPNDNISSVVNAFIVLGYAFGSVFLPAEAMSAAVVMNTVILAMMPALNRSLPTGEVYEAMGISMSIGILLAVGTGIRAAIERSRLGEVRMINTELDEIRRSLEVRVEERTRAMQTIADISRRLSNILNPVELAQTVVDEVQKAFSYYHVQMYQWDAGKETLVLMAATGEAGQSMLQFEHKVLPGRGLVGRAAETGQPILATDARAEAGWLPNPLLPETRSEVAVPVLMGDELVGVLDVQSDQANKLGQTDVDQLRSLANQLGIALQNANQYASTQAALQEMNIFRQFADNAGQGFSLTRLNGESYYVNPALLKLVGVTDASQIANRQASSFYPEDIRQKLTEILPEVYNSGQWVGEMALQTLDGRIRPTLENLFLIKDAQEQPLFVADVITDIEATKATQQALAQQADELAKVAHIGTEISAITDPADLLQQAVDHILESFGFYYVQVYLVNAAADHLELSAGAGGVGQKLVERGWKIPLSSERSLVARAVQQRQGMIANHVKDDPYFLPNDLLPKTAAEMAVPLMAGETVLGVLDVQADQPERFTPGDIAIQTALAAQVAVAYQNALQYQQVQQSEELVRAIIDATPDWIFIKDVNHRYRLVNQSYAQTCGLTKETMIGKNDLDIGFDKAIVMGDPERGIIGFWADDDEVVRSGNMKVVPSEPSMMGDEMHYLSTIKVPLKDEHGQVTGVLGFVRDITDRERLQKETVDRLAEIDGLYRTLSRQGWQAFQQQRSQMQTSFYFDRSEVHPDDQRWAAETQAAMQQNALVQIPGQPVVAAPLSLRGDVIGALAVQTDEQHPLSADEMALLQEMSDQIALAMESARLFTQTQTALADTEMLYSIIAEMNAASGYQDILHTLAERTLLGKANPLLLMAVFDQPLSGEMRPEWIFPVAYRASGGLSVAERYPLSAFEAKPGTLFTDRPVILDDLASDARLDRVTRTLFQEVFQACSSVVFPLMLGKQMIGFIQAFYDTPTDFPAEEETRLTAVTGQAAIAVQSRLLLEQAQSRALREQRIRQVTTEVMNATNVNTILRRAVEQVGQALGLPAYIYLGTKETGEKSE